MNVHFLPYVPTRNDIITYSASTKLTETTSWFSGLKTDAFNTTIKSHTFENGVGTIEFNADVTTIGDSAFYGCTGMTAIELPNSVTSIIGEFAFGNCGSLTMNVPTSLVNVGDCTFPGTTLNSEAETALKAINPSIKGNCPP